jgi:hypothetical protein
MIRRLSMTRICSQRTTESWVNPPDTCRNQRMRRQHGTANAHRKWRNNGMRTDSVRAVDLDNKRWPDAQVQQRGRTYHRLLTVPPPCNAPLSPPSAATSG